MDGTLIIALDSNQKNQVRGVFLKPEKMDLETAEALVGMAYHKANNDQSDENENFSPEDILVPYGITGVNFLTTLVDD